MLTNPFKGVGVPDTVRKELTARAETSKLLKWTAKRVPWIHVMSMSSACDGSKYKELGSSKAALNLFGASPTKALYEYGTFLPLPNITGVDVGALGNLGSTRKATIKLKAYTDEQLVELQKCYFIPGMDVRCQFGWSESCIGDDPPAVFTSDNVDRGRAVCEIYNKAASSTCYDGFQGIVSNFKYNLQNDNTWDCEIELISPADPFAESTVSNAECGCARKTTTTDADGNSKEGIAKNGQVYAMLLDIFNKPENGAKWKSKLKNNKYAGPEDLKKTIGYASRFMFAKARTEIGGDDASFYEGWLGDDYSTTEQYISYGMLEAAINAYTIPNAIGLPYGRVDSSGIKLPIPTTLLATDPRVCVIGGGKTFSGSGGGAGASAVLIVVAPVAGLVLSALGATSTDMEATTKLTAGGITPAASTDGVELCNIELNVVFLMTQLKKVLDGDRLMGTFIRAVVEEINRTCGNPWNIQIIANSDNQHACGDKASLLAGAAISVVDTKLFKNDQGVYLVPAKVGKSALRSLGLDLKMTGGMKTQALYGPGTQQRGSGNASSGGDATGCEGKALEPFYVGGEVKNKAIPTAKKLTAEEKASLCDCDEIDDAKSVTPPTLEELGTAATVYISDETCGALLTKLVETIHEQPKTHCDGVMLPFDFNFEVDGIGGFRWGQMVSCDRIPQVIRDGMQWQVTKVDHSITPNDWVTKVSTVARPKG